MGVFLLSVKGEYKMNLLDAVNELIKFNKQGISAALEGTMPGVQIRLNRDYPTTLPLELWETESHEPKGMWNPTIEEWQSQSWQVKY